MYILVEILLKRDFGNIKTIIWYKYAVLLVENMLIKRSWEEVKYSENRNKNKKNSKLSTCV